MNNYSEETTFKANKDMLSDDLRALLSAGSVATQEDLCTTLETKGHVVNQSKVSRLLHKIGAIKSKSDIRGLFYLFIY